MVQGRTSKEWWDEVKVSPEKTIRWLHKQYYGELKSAERIQEHCINKLDPKDDRIISLEVIRDQELKHAAHMQVLLGNRGQIPITPENRDRYWNTVVPSITTFEEAAAIAHHIEVMSLERIEVVATDLETPPDIKDVFKKVLKEEKFHAKTFAILAGDEVIERTRPDHRAGAKAIGFVTRAEAV